MRAYNFGAKGSNFRKFFHVTCRDTGMIICVQLLAAKPPPPKIWEDKKRPKLGEISANVRL